MYVFISTRRGLFGDFFFGGAGGSGWVAGGGEGVGWGVQGITKSLTCYVTNAT